MLDNKSNTKTGAGIVAIIVAAGSGSRFGAPLPKQFCMLQGRPVLCTTIDAFSRLLPLSAIRVVISGDMRPLWERLCKEVEYVTPAIIYGGATRWESVKNAIEALAGFPDETIVLIHDGARPFPSERLIRELVNLTENEVGRIAAIPVTDSIRLCNSDGSSEAVDRSVYKAVQTPQCFRLATLRAAYSRPYEPSMTDDASVVEAARLGKITLVAGETYNIKITSPHDLKVAEAIAETLTSSNSNIDRDE